MKILKEHHTSRCYCPQCGYYVGRVSDISAKVVVCVTCKAKLKGVKHI